MALSIVSNMNFFYKNRPSRLRNKFGANAAFTRVPVSP